MEIILRELKLENFKGIKDLSISPNGQGLNAVIEGMNGTGKTTTFDAFLYLLFGKDSQGRADFSIKTLNPDGSEIHNLNHSVEAVIEISGEPTRLEKTYHEQYIQKRGTSFKEFTGHTTQYKIDGVPKTKKLWDEFIAGIIDEDVFRLLTDPMYFNSPKIKAAKNQSDWQKRREILLEVCGNVSDQDVIESDKTLAGLNDILNNHSIDDQKAIIAAQKKKINERLKEIPARIDELNNSVADTSGHNVPKIEKKIKSLEEKIQQAKDDKSASILRQQRLDIQTSIRELESQIEEKKRKARQEATKELDQIQEKIERKKRELSDINHEIENKGTHILHNDRKMGDLREEFKNIQTQTFTPRPAPDLDNSACPQCGYILNSEQNKKRLEEYTTTVKKAEEDFKSNQVQTIDGINKQGKILKEDNSKYKAEIEKLEKDRDEIEKWIKELKAQEDSAKENANRNFDIISPENKIKIEKLNAELVEIDKKIEGAQPPDTSELEAQVRAEQVKLAEIESNKRTKKRLEELMQEEKTLAAEYEKLEGQIALIEKFIVQKVSLLEEKINSKFQLARFKLFEVQINQGIKEVCETTYNGVPYSSGLNTGAQINVGLDIIRTLSEYYGVQAPIFVDHAESVNEILPAGSQMIYLKVSEDQELKVTYL